MNFQRDRVRDEPEINLIPMIDVFLVIIIFLMVTTVGEGADPQIKRINVSVDASERYAINDSITAFSSVQNMSQALRAAAGGQKDPNIVIDADAKATHQSVINLMEAARLAGYGRIIFTTSRK